MSHSLLNKPKTWVFINAFWSYWNDLLSPKSFLQMPFPVKSRYISSDDWSSIHVAHLWGVPSSTERRVQVTCSTTQRKVANFIKISEHDYKGEWFLHWRLHQTGKFIDIVGDDHGSVPSLASSASSLTFALFARSSFWIAIHLNKNSNVKWVT